MILKRNISILDKDFNNELTEYWSLQIYKSTKLYKVFYLKASSAVKLIVDIPHDEITLMYNKEKKICKTYEEYYCSLHSFVDKAYTQFLKQFHQSQTKCLDLSKIQDVITKLVKSNGK